MITSYQFTEEETEAHCGKIKGYQLSVDMVQPGFELRICGSRNQFLNHCTVVTMSVRSSLKEQNRRT